MAFITNITDGTPQTGTFGPDGQPSGINNNGGVFPTPLSLSSGAVGGGSVSGIDSTGIRTGLNAGMNWLAGEAFFLGTGNTASNSNQHGLPLSQTVTTRFVNTARRRGWNPTNASFSTTLPSDSASLGLWSNKSQKEGGPFAGDKNIDEAYMSFEGDSPFNTGGNAFPAPSPTQFISTPANSPRPQIPCQQRSGDNPDLCSCYMQRTDEAGKVWMAPYCADARTTAYPCVLTEGDCGSASGPGRTPLSGYELPIFSGVNYDAKNPSFGLGDDSGNPQSGYWIRIPSAAQIPELEDPTLENGDRIYQARCGCWQQGRDNTALAYLFDWKKDFRQDQLANGGCAYKMASGLRPRGSGVFLKCGRLANENVRNRYSRCRCAWAHRMVYMGTDINTVTGLNCDPTGAQWFYEAPMCDNQGNVNPHSGRLYGCDQSSFNTDQVLCLTYVTTRDSCGSDDPCFCSEAYDAGPKFLPEYSGAIGSGEEDLSRVARKCYDVVTTGCLADLGRVDGDLLGGSGDLYVIASGAEPYWDPDTCGWITPIQLATTGSASRNTSETGAPWTEDCLATQSECYGLLFQPDGASLLCAVSGTPVISLSDRYLHNANKLWYEREDPFETSNILRGFDFKIDYKCCQKFASGAPECYNLKTRGPKYPIFTWVNYDAPDGDRHEQYEADRNWIVANAFFSGAQPDPAATPPLPEGQYRTPSGDPNCQWVYTLMHYICGPMTSGAPIGVDAVTVPLSVPEWRISSTLGVIGCPSGDGIPTGFCYDLINSGAAYDFGSYVQYDDGSGHTGCWIITDTPGFSGIASGGSSGDCDWTYRIQWYGEIDGTPQISGAQPGQEGYPIIIRQSDVSGCTP
jgi:hypothetical protein